MSSQSTCPRKRAYEEVGIDSVLDDGGIIAGRADSFLLPRPQTIPFSSYSSAANDASILSTEQQFVAHPVKPESADYSSACYQREHACGESPSKLSPDELLETIFADHDTSGSHSCTSSELAIDRALETLSGVLDIPSSAPAVGCQYPGQFFSLGRDSTNLNEAYFDDGYAPMSPGEGDLDSSFLEEATSSQEENGDAGDGQISDFDDDDVDALLENVDGAASSTDREKPPRVISRERFFLVDRGDKLFEFLPEGWVKVLHHSGMPIYFHRATRVCCMSRPYELDRASLRGHKIPVSAIPCLQYRRAKAEEERKVAGLASAPVETVSVGESAEEHTTEVVSADDHLQKSLLSPVDVRTYCSSVFDFQQKTIRRYVNWKVGRGRQKLIRKLRAVESGGQADEAPASTLKTSKIVSISRPSADGNSSTLSFFLNPANKTPVSILHEYVQHTKKFLPEYEFMEMPDSNTPYEAIIRVDQEEVGRGLGASKKAAKLEAAKVALAKLVPELNPGVDYEEALAREEKLFEHIAIEDSRVMEITFKSGIAGPYQLLTNALRRLHAHTPDQIKFQTKRLSHLKNEYTMTTPKHEVTVIHEKRNDAKQMAAQKLLKLMHPQLKYYGEILKLYGREYTEDVKSKKKVQRAITDLQGKGGWGEPNWELLEKLRQEMKKVVPVPLQAGESSRIRYD